VITSRPGAWDAKSATRARSRGVAELQPLTWDDDIKPFIQTWFSADRERAVALIGRLDSDLRLREAPTVPLFLTFYCIHARTAPPTSPLHRTRFDLYEWVIEQLLAGDWTRGERPERTNEAKGLLVEWAWHAVEH
ncbi:hypothetical protein PUY80_18455, partial [Plantibacter flavus]|uniref:hypothetical protein n=1 Tax=Plantibacter flavus TaxID=150123 RepID=UPI002378F262